MTLYSFAAVICLLLAVKLNQDGPSRDSQPLRYCILPTLDELDVLSVSSLVIHGRLATDHALKSLSNVDLVVIPNT
jgi:hypothetical protein